MIIRIIRSRIHVKTVSFWLRFYFACDLQLCDWRCKYFAARISWDGLARHDRLPPCFTTAHSRYYSDKSTRFATALTSRKPHNNQLFSRAESHFDSRLTKIKAISRRLHCKTTSTNDACLSRYRCAEFIKTLISTWSTSRSSASSHTCSTSTTEFNAKRS